MALAEDKRTAPTSRKTSRYGWLPDLPDPRDRIFNLEEAISRADQVPPKVDLSPNMPPIYNQGHLGSCTGNGIARALEYEQTRQSEPAVTPSRLFIYYNERVIEGTVNQDSGGQIRDGIKVVATLGAPPEAEWPYSDANPGPFEQKPPPNVYQDATKHEALVYKRVLLGGAGAPLRTALAAGYPVVFGFSVPMSFEDGSWDPTKEPLPVPGPGEQFIGGHCVVMSGYDFTRTRFSDPAFQIENSWGEGWGMGGRFWMDAHWFDPNAGLVSDLWVITKVT
ncbi:MAG: C1 family peptidase [Solirubrobacterales bacterium]|nr:C1 family peptidase [Solirubrobacterales bacterium]